MLSQFIIKDCALFKIALSLKTEISPRPSTYRRITRRTKMGFSRVVTWCVVITLLEPPSAFCHYTCLFGNDLPSPQDGTLVADCGPHETCYLEQYITPAGYVRNKVGCKDTSFCGATTISGPNVGVCSQCCTGDLCATTLCGNTGWPQNTGPICYHCDYSVDSPDLCDSIRICGKDEFCGVASASGGKYEVKCMRQAACSQVSSTSACGSCCSTQLCNSKCNPTQTNGAPVCADDTQCQSLTLTFQAAGQNICQLDSMKVFCNKTCSLCQVMSTSPQTTSATSIATSPTPLLTSGTTSQSTAANPCSSNPCIHGVCSVSGTAAKCTCASGYTGVTCDRTDPCANSPCVHGVCSSLVSGAFLCTCKSGFTGGLCDAAISPCSTDPCVHGTCTTAVNGYQCSCLSGFVGQLCDKTDPCTGSPCVHGVCTTLTNGTFYCTCSSGFTGKLCDQSVSPCTNNPCIHGTCSSTGNQATCSCHQGYVGTYCNKVDPCKTLPCIHGVCTTLTDGTFQCTCNSGFTGLLCDAPISPCKANPCHSGICSDNGGGFRCTCQSGYVGKLCDTLDPCSTTPCIHGVCSTLTNGTFQCTCSSGFSGLLCDKVNPCSASPCAHGVCTFTGNGKFTCTCNSGFAGLLCDRGDPCTVSPCAHGTCSSTQSGGFLCACSPGYTGILCDTQILSCSTNPCIHGSCTNKGTGYGCNCDKGYAGVNCDREIKDCKDIKENSVMSTTGDDVYLVKLNGHPTDVLCDMRTDGGGWTVLMNRENGNQNFEDQDFSTYASGFGDIRDNFWTGLENMNAITEDGRRYQLRVELTVANGSKYIESYDDFSVGPPSDFVLHVGNYNGNAGDSLSGHDGFGFTTKGVDNDSNSGINCGVYLHGAWWFHNCYDSCLTCPYVTPGTNECRSFSWNSLGYCIALKSARLMVRPM